MVPGLLLFSLLVAHPIQRSPVLLDFDIVHRQKPLVPGLQDKSIAGKSVLVQLENRISLYVAEVELGTPAQKIKCLLDTGSLDLWVPLVGSFSQLALNPQYGAFNLSASSSYKKFRDNFLLVYGDHTRADGVWASDVLSLLGLSVGPTYFGLAESQTTGFGVLGLGFTENESSTWVSANEPGTLSQKELEEKGLQAFTYDNYPTLLKQKGYINKVAYSLYLNSTNASKGSILFGAVDTAKVKNMAKMDILNIDTQGNNVLKPLSFFVQLDLLNIGGSSFCNQSYPALLDSGSSVVFAPAAVFAEIVHKYAKYRRSTQDYVIPCNAKLPDMKFNFKDTTISVPFDNMLIQLRPEDQLCTLAMSSSDTSYFILGETFLRSAYVLYDLEDNTIGIGEAVYTTKSNIVFL